ncbi:MAG: hypothetical protein AB1744_01845 [Candidatus Zixiibacteriota bacterium]
MTLYYADTNPYHRILDIYYYKRESLRIRQIDSLQSLSFNENQRCLFVTRDPGELGDVPYAHTPVYSTFPEWVRLFNFNNWIERTGFWYVYELNAFN